MIKCLLSRAGLLAGPLFSTPLQINSQPIPRLDPIDSKSSFIQLSNQGFSKADNDQTKQKFVYHLRAIPCQMMQSNAIQKDQRSAATSANKKSGCL